MAKKFSLIFLLILSLLVLVSCADEEEYPTTHIIYNPEISHLVLVQGRTYNILNFEGENEKTTIFDLYLNIDSINPETNLIDYQMKVVNALGEDKVFRSKKNPKLPVRDQLIFSTNVGGNGFSEFFIKVNAGEKHYFYEEGLNKSNTNIMNETYADIYTNEEVKLNIFVEDEGERYNLDFVINSQDNYHLDFQSFIVSEKLEIFSFLEIYSHFNSQNQLQVSNNYIYKDIEILYLYIRMFYYDFNGAKTEVRVRYLLDDLIF